MGEPPPRPDPDEVTGALAALPEPLAAALTRLWDILPGARLVGGAVRDLLVGRPVADLDLATELPPAEVMRAAGAAGYVTIPTGLAHGTVSLMIDGQRLEITTLRRDVATDGRHARVAWTMDWDEDAARRDFTFNAMSLDRHGRLHDPFGGLADLRAGRVRFVGDPASRLDEDRLRALRYFRFLARFGDTSDPDPKAVAAIAGLTARGGGDGLARLSPERIWSELRRLFETPHIASVTALMRRLGVWRAVFGDTLRDQGTLLDALEAAHDPTETPPALVRLAALTAPGHATSVADRLRLSRAEASALAALIGHPALPRAATPGQLRAARDTEALDTLTGRTWLAQAAAAAAGDGSGDTSGSWPDLRRRLARTEVPAFPVGGADALAAGIPPGPAVGAALAELRGWWRDGGCTAAREDCLAVLAARRC